MDARNQRLAQLSHEIASLRRLSCIAFCLALVSMIMAACLIETTWKMNRLHDIEAVRAQALAVRISVIKDSGCCLLTRAKVDPYAFDGDCVKVSSRRYCKHKWLPGFKATWLFCGQKQHKQGLLGWWRLAEEKHVNDDIQNMNTIVTGPCKPMARTNFLGVAIRGTVAICETMPTVSPRIANDLDHTAIHSNVTSSFNTMPLSRAYLMLQITLSSPPKYITSDGDLHRQEPWKVWLLNRSTRGLVIVVTICMSMALLVSRRKCRHSRLPCIKEESMGGGLAELERSRKHPPELYLLILKLFSKLFLIQVDHDHNMSNVPIQREEMEPPTILRHSGETVSEHPIQDGEDCDISHGPISSKQPTVETVAVATDPTENTSKFPMTVYYSNLLPRELLINLTTSLPVDFSTPSTEMTSLHRFRTCTTRKARKQKPEKSNPSREAVRTMVLSQNANIPSAEAIKQRIAQVNKSGQRVEACLHRLRQERLDMQANPGSWKKEKRLTLINDIRVAVTDLAQQLG